MQNHIYSLKTFSINGEEVTYPVIKKGYISLDGENTAYVYIDVCNGGFLISVNESSIRIPPDQATKGLEACIKQISESTIGISEDKAAALCKQYIQPSIIQPDSQKIDSFLLDENFFPILSTIEANYKHGYRNGKTILKHISVPSLFISVKWRVLNNNVSLDTPELIGANTSSLERKNYLEYRLKQIPQKHVTSFLKKYGYLA